MRIVRCLLLSLSLCHAAAVVSAASNAVLYWNERTLNAIRLARTLPPVAAIHMATVHVAIFDAVNGVTRTHRGWLINESAPAGVDVDAAIASAAYTTLVALWKDAANPHNFNLAYAQALAKIPEGKAKIDGIAWGERVAKTVLAKRAACGLDRTASGTFSSDEPGLWRETPPGFRPAILPHLGGVTPFVIPSPEQFRAPPPPPLNSREFADDLAFVARVGARDGAERTEYQTLSTPFWADDLGTCTPPGHWNMIAADIAKNRGVSVAETARLFALLNLTAADAGIACWDSKYHYRLWRPETAIREMNERINPHAKPDPGFIPNMASPAFPTYTSGHSTFSAACARVLEVFLGTDEIEFTTTSDALPGSVRTFKRLSECRDEVGMSRVWGGIHFQFDNDAGKECGRTVADYVIANALSPVGHSSAAQ